MNMKKIGLGSIAAAGAAALVMGLGTPAMAAVSPTFGGLTASEPGSVTVPKSSTGTVKTITVNFNGPVAPSNNPAQITYGMYDSNFYSPKAVIYQKNSKLSSTRVSAPTITSSSSVSPAAANQLQVKVWSFTTPGVYKIAIPITQHDRRVSPYKNNTLFVTKYLTVKANTSLSKKATYASGSPKYGRAFKVKVTAPGYQAGAKVTAYVKLPGKKKYKKVTSGRLKTSSYVSKASLKISSKYNKNKARFYFKVSAAPYAGSYKTTTYKITVRRY